MSPKLVWVLALVWGPAVASAQCYEDTHCFYTCGYGYYQRAGKVNQGYSRLFGAFGTHTALAGRG